MAAMAMLLNPCRVFIARVPLQRVGGGRVSGISSGNWEIDREINQPYLFCHINGVAL